MSKKRALTLFFITLFLPFHAFSEDARMTAELIDSPVIEGQSIKGTLKIYHEEKQKVDVSSFKIKNNPLKIDFVSTQPTNKKNSVLSTYQFEVEPETKGIQMLPTIKGKVGERSVSSIPFTFTVIENRGQAAPTSVESSAETETPSANRKKTLKLEAIVDGLKELYPGQRTRLVYRYTFSGQIALTKEALPMLEATGMRKIGEKEIKDRSNGDLNVTEISQRVEALAPGEFSYGPSLAEGYAYADSDTGKRNFFQPVLRVEAPAVKIKVIAFPEQGKPASFNNALGDIKISTQLLDPSFLQVGDPVTLSIEFTGTGDLEDLQLPDICCLPGFSGRFMPSDLPPVGIIKGDTKYFVADIRPLSSSIKEIPSIEFSSFDPKTGKYITSKSQPIPVKVTGADIKIPEAKENGSQGSNWLKPAESPKPMDFTNESLDASKAESTYANWWLLLLIPIGLYSLYLQWRKRTAVVKLAEAGPQTSAKKSGDLYLEAIKVKSDPAKYFSLITRAFLFGLFEKKWIPSPDLSSEELPAVGISKEVRDFLFMVDEIRFSRPNEQVSNELIEHTKELFTKLQQSPSKE